MLAIDRFQALCSELIEHHSKNIEVLASIDAEQHQIATLGLINVIRLEVIQPLEEMELMLEMFSKMGLVNVPYSMIDKWEGRFQSLLSRLGVIS